MPVDVVRAQPEHGEVLGQLFQLYAYDFSEFVKLDVDEHGRYAGPAFQGYFGDENCFPYLVQVDGRLAGFAIVRRGSRLCREDNAWDMEEFFVLRRYRRCGVGREVACLLFERHIGWWELRQRRENSVAIAFWRATVDAFTGGEFRETLLDDERWRGPVQRFCS